MPNRKIRSIVEGQTVLALSGDTTVVDAARRMADAHVGSVLVLAGGRLAGIFTERDALNRVLAKGVDPKATRLDAVMTPNPLTVHPDKPLGHALHMMFEGGFRHVPVVEDGRPIGMVSARDALGLELVEFEHELEQRDEITERL